MEKKIRKEGDSKNENLKKQERLRNVKMESLGGPGRGVFEEENVGRKNPKKKKTPREKKSFWGRCLRSLGKKREDWQRGPKEM